ncbi:MAG: glycosyltransferase family 4 protein [Porticoccaceae bacterium]|nr:glycosyltransferase family 4 protein [Porticoccaceae bacterium]
MPSNTPKKILYVENGIGYGGAIICLRQLVRNLDRKRFTPMVVTGRSGPQYQEIANDTKWKHIPDRHVDIVGAHRKIDPARWINKIPGMRFTINQILARADDLCNFLPFFFHLLWTAFRFKPDLIHANNEPLCNRAALLAGKLLNIPTLCHVRGDQDGSRLMKWAFKMPTHFVPVSHWVSDSIHLKMGVPQNQISVIYDGLEMDALDRGADGRNFRKISKITDDEFAVGLVGMLIPWKGQDIFLEAAILLKEKIPNLKMVLIGGTPDDFLPYENKLRNQVKNQDLEDTVIFSGHNGDMSTVYNGLDIVVSASTSPEPLGIVVIEAMAMSRPVIAPDHGGAIEIIEDGVTGRLFKASNATSLAKSIAELYHSKEERRKIGEAARSHVLSAFSVDTHVMNIQAVYTSLLK